MRNKCSKARNDEEKVFVHNVFLLVLFFKICGTVEVCDARNDATCSTDRFIKILNLWKRVTIMILSSEILIRVLIREFTSIRVPINFLSSSESDITHITNRCNMCRSLYRAVQVFHFS